MFTMLYFLGSAELRHFVIGYLQCDIFRISTSSITHEKCEVCINNSSLDLVQYYVFYVLPVNVCIIFTVKVYFH